MTGWITRAAAGTIAAALALLAAPLGAQPALVVGAVVSQTGAHADLALGYGRGLELWSEEVNAAGGLLGRRVELRVLDDGSSAARSGALYRQLIQEKVDVLVGPYGTAATLVAAAEAESAPRVLINGAGWSRAVHKRAPRYVFQSAVPYNAYGTPVLDLARRSGAKTAWILSRDDSASLEMAGAAAQAAARLGIAAGEVRTYSGSALEFALLVERARGAGVEAWIAFGEARDAAEMIKAFKKQGYAPKIAFVRAVGEGQVVGMVGQDAEFAMGSAAFHARRPGAEAFAAAYQARWEEAPGAAAAEGYAAGTVLAEGVRRAGTAEPRALRAALAGLQTRTVLGSYRVDAATGEQLAAAPVVVQILFGRPEVVAPEKDAATAPVVPYPAWDERRILK